MFAAARSEAGSPAAGLERHLPAALGRQTARGLPCKHKGRQSSRVSIPSAAERQRIGSIHSSAYLPTAGRSNGKRQPAVLPGAATAGPTAPATVRAARWGAGRERSYWGAACWFFNQERSPLSWHDRQSHVGLCTKQSQPCGWAGRFPTLPRRRVSSSHTKCAGLFVTSPIQTSSRPSWNVPKALKLKWDDRNLEQKAFGSELPLNCQAEPIVKGALKFQTHRTSLH